MTARGWVGHGATDGKLAAEAGAVCTEARHAGEHEGLWLSPPLLPRKAEEPILDQAAQLPTRATSSPFGAGCAVQRPSSTLGAARKPSRRTRCPRHSRSAGSAAFQLPSASPFCPAPSAAEKEGGSAVPGWACRWTRGSPVAGKGVC